MLLSQFIVNLQCILVPFNHIGSWFMHIVSVVSAFFKSHFQDCGILINKYDERESLLKNSLLTEQLFNLY